MYRTYKFRNQDPVVTEVRDMFLRLSELKDMKKIQVSKMSGVSSGATYNLLNKKTLRPHNATVEATARALGFARKWVPYNIGRRAS